MRFFKKNIQKKQNLEILFQNLPVFNAEMKLGETYKKKRQETVDN